MNYLQARYREREEGEGEFIFPYNLGWKGNFRMVFTWHPDPRVNGMWWPIVAGTDQYTLTVSSPPFFFNSDKSTKYSFQASALCRRSSGMSAVPLQTMQIIQFLKPNLKSRT